MRYWLNILMAGSILLVIWSFWEREYPDRVRAFLYASQWSAVNKLATEQEHDLDEVQLISPWQSAVQVEDYQLFPVLKAMLMPRISMLLADDVGRGKTIEAGLILSELYARRFLSLVRGGTRSLS